MHFPRAWSKVLKLRSSLLRRPSRCNLSGLEFGVRIADARQFEREVSWAGHHLEEVWRMSSLPLSSTKPRGSLLEEQAYWHDWPQISKYSPRGGQPKHTHVSFTNVLDEPRVAHQLSCPNAPLGCLVRPLLRPIANEIKQYSSLPVTLSP